MADKFKITYRVMVERTCEVEASSILDITKNFRHKQRMNDKQSYELNRSHEIVSITPIMCNEKMNQLAFALNT